MHQKPAVPELPRPRNTIREFSVDRNGRAFTKVRGRFISLGRGDDPQSRIRYAAVLTEQASGQPVTVTAPKAAVTLNELFLKYVTDELPRFSQSERRCQMTVIRMVRQLFGSVPVADFGPLKLRAVRDAMVAGDPNQKDRAGKPNPRKPWSRNTVNRQVKRLRAIIPPRQADGLIAAKSRCLVDPTVKAARVVQILFGARDEERRLHRQLVEASEVDIAAVDHVERSRLDRQVVENCDIVCFPMCNADKAGNVATQIQQRVQFDCSFATAEFGPRKQIQTYEIRIKARTTTH
jgi:hypothetical protein